MEQQNKKIIVSEKKKEQLVNMPIIETKHSTSKDGQYYIVKTIITDIKPTKYVKKVLTEDMPEAHETLATTDTLYGADYNGL